MESAQLYCYNCDCEFGVFCCELTASFRIFGHENFLALLIILRYHCVVYVQYICISQLLTYYILDGEHLI